MLLLIAPVESQGKRLDYATSFRFKWSSHVIVTGTLGQQCIREGSPISMTSTNPPNEPLTAVSHAVNLRSADCSLPMPSILNAVTHPPLYECDHTRPDCRVVHRHRNHGDGTPRSLSLAKEAGYLLTSIGRLCWHLRLRPVTGGTPNLPS